MLVIGITGTIGSGKSTVAGLLRELGAEVVDADEVGHQVYLPSSKGWKAIVETFGEGILAADGSVDRHKLGDLVFKNKTALSKLNCLVHPLITQEVQRRLKDLRKKETRVVAIEAAQLIEAGWSPLVDEVWVTTAPESVIFQRLTARRGLTPAQVQERLKAQLPFPEMLKYATRMIDTSVPLPELKSHVTGLWQELTK